MRKVAIIGAGMTKFARRHFKTPQELVQEASIKALEEAGLGYNDIDCVVIGSAPDAFDGVHQKGEYLFPAMNKPMTRVFIGGATGVMVPISGYYHVASGMCDKVLAIAEEKMSQARPHPQAVFRYIWDPILETPIGPNLLWIFAMEMHRYMYAYKVPKEDIALVSVKNKANAADNPYAQLGGRITVDDVIKSEVLVWPVNRLDVSPVSDGAAAVVMVSEDVARRYTDTPVWVAGVGWTLDNTEWTGRDLSYNRYLEIAGRMAYKMAGIERPNKEIDVAEPYDPFDYKELMHLEALQLAPKGKAAQLVKEGVFNRDGDLPSSPGGGLLGVGNPIAAAGLMKVISLYWQLKGTAGKMQVKKPVYTGVAQAWGDLMQASTVVVLRR